MGNSTSNTIEEADVERTHSPWFLFQFHLCFPLENSTWLTHCGYALIILCKVINRTLILETELANFILQMKV